MVQKNNLSTVIVVCGPTASGKSALAIELAKQLNTEIICADALTVYKGLDIGTAKPSDEEKGIIKHHLLDVVEPNQNFSVGDYKTLAQPILENIIAQNKIPIICGGTGFYINSLIFDLSYGNSIANLQARNKYFELAEKHGKEYVFNILLEKDPKSAQKLHFNDLKRVVRALEIYESGFLKSDIQDQLTPKYNVKTYSFDYEREILYDRINKRVDQMIENNLVGEVKALVQSGINISHQSMQGIGYKEIYSYLQGEISLEDAIELIKLNTRHYAKRQITFFKKSPNITYIKPNNIELIAKEIIKQL